jgi:hypothetical protein
VSDPLAELAELEDVIMIIKGGIKMGYYMEVPANKEKVKQLIEMYGATRFKEVTFFADVPEGKALVIVVENLNYDAAKYIDNRKTLADIHKCIRQGDNRPRTWLLIDKDKVFQNILENHRIDLSPKISMSSPGLGNSGHYCPVCDIDCRTAHHLMLHHKGVKHFLKYQEKNEKNQ